MAKLNFGNLVDVIQKRINEAEDYDVAMSLVKDIREIIYTLESQDDAGGFSEKNANEQRKILKNISALYAEVEGQEETVEKFDNVISLKGDEFKAAAADLVKTVWADNTSGDSAQGDGDDPPLQETVNLSDQEIIAAGDYGLKGAYTSADLQQIVDNAGKLGDTMKPPFKIGHLEGFGLPAIGWVKGLKLNETKDKVLADFDEVPKTAAEMIKSGRYKRVSPEIYRDFTDSEGNKHGKVLRAVALLGADVPEMKTLSDLKVLYNTEDLNEVDVVLDEKLADGKQGKQSDKNKNAQEDNMSEDIKKLQEETARLRAVNVAHEVREFMETNKAKVTPAMRPVLASLLEHAELNQKEEEVVTFSEKDKDGNEQEVKLSVAEGIKTLVGKLPDIVQFEEQAKGTGDIDTETEELNRVKKYSEEHNVSLEDARRALEIGIKRDN